MSDAPRRVRVTARDGARRPAPATRGIATVNAPIAEADAVYSRALRTTQLRLALGTVAGFLVVTVALAIAITAIPELDRVAAWGVPVSWLLHAFAFYPVIAVFAVLYVRGAARNERRYRDLQERE